MRDPATAPTMHDVAQAAGVSMATVSRALAGNPGVDPTRVDAVHQAVRILGYQRRRSTRPPAPNTGPLLDLARWLVALDDPANRAARRAVSLPLIIDRARAALGKTDA
jgi:hypothetical protein